MKNRWRGADVGALRHSGGKTGSECGAVDLTGEGTGEVGAHLMLQRPLLTNVEWF